MNAPQVNFWNSLKPIFATRYKGYIELWSPPFIKTSRSLTSQYYDRELLYMNQTKIRNSPPLCKTNPVLLLDRRRRFPARRRRPKSLATSAVTLLSKSNKEQAQASEPQERKTRRKLLQVPGGSAPRELADLARLRQSLRTKMSPPLALTWSWAIFFFEKERERACLNLLQARQSGSYVHTACCLWNDGRIVLHGEKFSHF